MKCTWYSTTQGLIRLYVKFLSKFLLLHVLESHTMPVIEKLNKCREVECMTNGTGIDDSHSKVLLLIVMLSVFSLVDV